MKRRVGDVAARLIYHATLRRDKRFVTAIHFMYDEVTTSVRGHAMAKKTVLDKLPVLIPQSKLDQNQ
jgi:hypothetical protein